MFNGVVKSFVITSFCAACGFFCTVLVQNKLTVQEAGRFVLMLTLVQACAMLVTLGDEKLLRRYFSSFDAGDYAWRKIVRSTLLRALPLTFLVLLWCRYQYDLGLTELVVAGLAIMSFSVSLMRGSILQSKERFGLLAWTVGGHRLIMLLLLVIVLIVLNKRSLVACEAAIGLGFISITLLSGYWCLAQTPEGTKQIPKPFRRESLYFLGTTVSFMVYNYLDRMMIPAVLGEEALAGYFAVYNPFLVFDMAAMALGSVVIVKLARPDASLKKYALGLLGLALIGYLLCLLSFGPLVHLLYNGRYDAFRYLIPLIGLSKCLNLVLVFPTSMLGGRLGRKALAFFAKTNVALIPADLFLVWMLARFHGLTGVAVGMLVIGIQWNLVGMTAVFSYSRTRIVTDRADLALEENKA